MKERMKMSGSLRPLRSVSLLTVFAPTACLNQANERQLV